MAHIDFLGRRLRLSMRGFDQEDVRAVLQEAERRQDELEHRVHEFESENKRLQSEVGRAYNAEAGISRTMVLAQEAASRIRADAEQSASETRAGAEQGTRLMLENARAEAREIVQDAVARADRIVAEAQTQIEEMRSSIPRMQGDLRTLATAGRNLIQGALGQFDAALALSEQPVSGIEVPDESLPQEVAPVSLESGDDEVQADTELQPASGREGAETLPHESETAAEEPNEAGSDPKPKQPPATSLAEALERLTGNELQQDGEVGDALGPTAEGALIDLGDTEKPEEQSDADGAGLLRISDASEASFDGETAQSEDTSISVDGSSQNEPESAPPSLPQAPEEARQVWRERREPTQDADGLEVGQSGGKNSPLDGLRRLLPRRRGA